MDLAARMIADAKRCGADYAKVQAYQTKFLRPGDPQEAWLKQAELSEENLRFLKRVCDDEGIKFLATVFDPERVPLIRELSDEVKIGSGEHCERWVSDALRATPFRREFVGCGMTGEQLGYPILGNETVPLFGVSAYPADEWTAALTLAKGAAWFHLKPLWGYSDHTVGDNVAGLAIALGAEFIEVHVALADSAPRLLCDKGRDSLIRICAWAHDPIRQLSRTARLARERFVGRWSHGR